MHRSAVRGHDETVDHHILPGLRFLELLASEDRVEGPCAYYVMRLGSHGHGEQLLVKLLIPLPERVVQRGARGVHPCIEYVGAAYELPAAFRALLYRRSVLSRIAIAHLLGCRHGKVASLALPYGYGGREYALSAQDPIPFE